MKLVSKEDVIKYQKWLIDRFGGLHGISDESKLDSALKTPLQDCFGEELHKTDIDKIAAFCYYLIDDHAFNDGNKRIGVFIMLMLLEINGFRIKYTQAELIELGLGVAKGELRHKDIKMWIDDHLV